jgi:hypothetical protein
MSPFERALWRWAEYNLFASAVRETYRDVPYLLVRADDLFRDLEVVRQIAEFFGLPPRRLEPPQLQAQNSTNPNLTSKYPLGDEWRRYKEYPYILELAERLGVPVRLEGLERRMRKYAAPSRWELWKYRWRIRFTRDWWRRKVGRLGSSCRRLFPSPSHSPDAAVRRQEEPGA